MKYTDYLTTVEAVTRQLVKAQPNNVPTGTSAQYDEYYDYLADAIPFVSGVIETECNRVFIPYKETKTYNFRAHLLSNDFGRATLFLEDDLHSISDVQWIGVSVSASDYLPLPENQLPYQRLLFDYSVVTYPSSFTDSITIAGMWGYVNNLANAYTDKVTVVGTLSSSATSITVADASIFETFQTLKIEDELLRIMEINTTTDVLTVVRGINGTTAAAHTNYTIRVFNILPEIQTAATRMAALMYQRRNDSAGQTQIGDASAVLALIPSFAVSALRKYKRFLPRVV